MSIGYKAFVWEPGTANTFTGRKEFTVMQAYKRVRNGIPGTYVIWDSIDDEFGGGMSEVIGILGKNNKKPKLSEGISILTIDRGYNDLVWDKFTPEEFELMLSDGDDINFPE